PDRAATSAAELRDALPAGAGVVDGVGNADACDRDIVVAAIPAEGAADLIAGVAEHLVGRILVSAISPLAFDAAGPRPGVVEGAPSAAEQLADIVPDARLVAGFHTVSAVTLR